MCSHAGALLSEALSPSYFCHLTSFSPLRWASLSFCRVWAMAHPFSPPPHVDTQSPNSFTSFSWVVAERGVVVPAGGRLDRRRLHGRKREDHMIVIYHIKASLYHVCMNKIGNSCWKRLFYLLGIGRLGLQMCLHCFLVDVSDLREATDFRDCHRSERVAESLVVNNW